MIGEKARNCVNSFPIYGSKIFPNYDSKHNNREGSQRELAKRFSVSLSFVQSLLRKYRSSGSFEPKPHGGGQSAKLNSEQIALVTLLVEEDNDAILVELCDTPLGVCPSGNRLQQRAGVKISRATMGRITQKLNLTRKKKQYMPVSGTPSEYKNLEQSIGQQLEA